MLKRDGKRCQEEDKETDDVNSRENDDGLVFSEVLIRDDGAQDRCAITPQRVESGQSCGSLMALAQRTTTKTSIKWSLNVILEKALTSVEGEAL